MILLVLKVLPVHVTDISKYFQEKNDDPKFNNDDLYSPLRSEEESFEAQSFEKELKPGSIASRDLHAVWIALSSNDISLSLATIRNVASPNVKVSRLLLLAGASPDHISDCLGKSPLIGVYSHLGYMDMINALIDFGADVNATNTDGEYYQNHRCYSFHKLYFKCSNIF